MSARREFRKEVERFRTLWCAVMHDNITWPRNGRYCCRTCGRQFSYFLEESVQPESCIPELVGHWRRIRMHLHLEGRA
jgi:transposase-like protein